VENFRSGLELCLQQSIGNNYTTNLDEIPVFSPSDKEILMNIRNVARDLMKTVDWDGYEKSYKLLRDDYSRKLYVDLIVMKAIGPTKKRLPLSDKNIWLKKFDIEDLCKREGTASCQNMTFNLFDLRPIGHDYQIYSNPEGIMFAYHLKEYEYHKNDVRFEAEEGDYIIDGGGFIGDTALYFAEKIGKTGKIFSFEFVKENLDVYNKNLELNPHFKDRIEIFENALWSDSKENLYVYGIGPATRVTMSEPPEYSLKIPSKSIDDLVDEQNIPKIDFIKLDIEGAEIDCLKGAKKTIEKFRPKLAVCIYHKPDDFITIPQLINDCHPYYDMYIDHHTATFGETVLYCVPKKECETKIAPKEKALSV